MFLTRNPKIMISSASWNISDANILIPVVENGDSLETNVVSELNDGSTLKHTLLIGLNKTFFGEASCSKDVIFVPNDVEAPELCVNMPVECEIIEDKANVSYFISFIDKNDIKYLDKSNVTLKKPRKNSMFKEVPNTANETFPSCDNSTENPNGEERFSDISKSVVNYASDEDIEGALLTTLVERKDCGDAGYSSLFSGKATLPDEHGCPSKKETKKITPHSSKNQLTRGTKVRLPKKKQKQVISIDEMKRLRQELKEKQSGISGKRKCCYSDSELSDNENDVRQNFDGDLNLNNLHSLVDLLNHLKLQELIDDDFIQLVLRGVAEMKVDIFQEIKKMACELPAAETFSYELLAFAYLIFYHKRDAYNYMSQKCKSSWPSTQKLVEWKKLVNSVPKEKPKKNR